MPASEIHRGTSGVGESDHKGQAVGVSAVEAVQSPRHRHVLNRRSHDPRQSHAIFERLSTLEYLTEIDLCGPYYPNFVNQSLDLRLESGLSWSTLGFGAVDAAGVFAHGSEYDGRGCGLDEESMETARGCPRLLQRTW